MANTVQEAKEVMAPVAVPAVREAAAPVANTVQEAKEVMAPAVVPEAGVVAGQVETKVQIVSAANIPV
ncbi:hypothetical protein [Neobacillus niacini]|uniref:hypothetical protein n=1 Tax=Neobacillus niacini TaxID=86668 RepID=UPI002863BDF4|nr:hypothetical protein [Neobacillus niacini]MDR7001649.1 hypothetical protein [Neobacillus niacini]